MTSPKTDVVLIEDNPNDAELALRSLRNYVPRDRLLLLEDGAKALDYFFGPLGGASGHVPLPKVVLLDLKLPKVSGFEVLGQLKSDERTRIVPVVVISSSSEERDIRESYRLGANSYLVKPVGFDEYASVLTEVGRYWGVLNRSVESKS